MSYFRTAAYAVVLIAASGVLRGITAQQSPYAGLTDRPIKALSESDLEALRSGAGMGYALAAELNQYPGPKHVLELRDSLGLSGEQTEAIQAVYDDMLEDAQALGQQLISAESSLDSLFASATVTPESLAAAVTRAGRYDSELRIVHLRAHLHMRTLLTEHQRQTYDQVRGYGAGHTHIHRP